MFHRSIAFASASTVLIASASARQEASTTYPLRAEPRHAGTYDASTGRRVSASAVAAATACPSFLAYDNTCTWTGGATTKATLPCEDVYDEGRLPPITGTGGTWIAWPSNEIDWIQIGYCTYYPTGQVDIDLALFDTGLLGGVCLGGVEPTGVTPTWSFTSATVGFPLPGSPIAGSQACWTVNLMLAFPQCLSNGPTSAELFNFKWRSNNPTHASGAESWIVSGEPSIAAGANTFNIPAGIDPLSGDPCGTGLGNADAFWRNFDDVPVGGPPSLACPSAAIGGSNCYWFGGHPADPFGGFWLRLHSIGGCFETGNPTAYCTAKTNSLGCVPELSACGTPHVGNWPPGFVITASNLLNNKSGLFFYGTSGLAASAFQGGHLCMKPPIQRLKLQSTGGNPPPNDCSGTLVEDFNDKINGIGYPLDPALTTGAQVGVQCWSRDPQSSSTTSLSGGLAFVIW